MISANALALNINEQCVGLLAGSDPDYMNRTTVLPSEYDGSFVQRVHKVIQGKTRSVIEKYLGTQYTPEVIVAVADLFKFMGEVGIGPKLYSFEPSKRLLVMEDLKTPYNQVFDGRLMQSLGPMQKSGLLTEADVTHLEMLYEIFQTGKMHLDFSPKNFVIVKEVDNPAQLFMLDNIRPPGSVTTIEQIRQVKAAISAALPFPKP